MSGKGGVGKSTISSNLARAIAKQCGKCGILDLDICGPSIPTIFGIPDAKIKATAENMMQPQIVDNVEVMSLGFLYSSKEFAAIWRGPKKNAYISQLLHNVSWTSKIIVVDLPPGTSDEHLSLFSELKQANAAISIIIVTTPSPLAITDVKKGISFLKSENVQSSIKGIVENFCGVICPCCGEISPLVEEFGVDQLSSDENIPILSKIPFTPSAAQNFDKGEPNENFFVFFDPIVKAIFP